MMSRQVGFITFPQGYKCSVFAAVKEKPPKPNSNLRGKDVNWNEGKSTLAARSDKHILGRVSVLDIQQPDPPLAQAQHLSVKGTTLANQDDRKLHDTSNILLQKRKLLQINQCFSFYIIANTQ